MARDAWTTPLPDANAPITPDIESGERRPLYGEGGEGEERPSFLEQARGRVMELQANIAETATPAPAPGFEDGSRGSQEWARLKYEQIQAAQAQMDQLRNELNIHDYTNEGVKKPTAAGPFGIGQGNVSDTNPTEFVIASPLAKATEKDPMQDDDAWLRGRDVKEPLREKREGQAEMDPTFRRLFQEQQAMNTKLMEEIKKLTEMVTGNRRETSSDHQWSGAGAGSTQDVLKPIDKKVVPRPATYSGEIA